MDPPGRQAAAAVTKQGKSRGEDSPSSPPLDPLSPTQLCKLGAVRHTANKHHQIALKPVCVAHSVCGKVCDYAASGCHRRVQSAAERGQSTRQSNTQAASQPCRPKHSWRDVPDTAVHAEARLRGT